MTFRWGESDWRGGRSAKGRKKRGKTTSDSNGADIEMWDKWQKLTCRRIQNSKEDLVFISLGTFAAHSPPSSAKAKNKWS